MVHYARRFVSVQAGQELAARRPTAWISMTKGGVTGIVRQHPESEI